MRSPNGMVFSCGLRAFKIRKRAENSIMNHLVNTIWNNYVRLHIYLFLAELTINRGEPRMTVQIL